MKKNKKFSNISFEDEHINVYEIIRHIIKKKKLIILTTLIFSLAGISYSFFKPKEFYSSAIAIGLSDSTTPIFNYYDQIAPPSLEKIGSSKKLKELSDELVREILIKKNFQEFLNTNDGALDFREFLKKNDISISEYVNDDPLEKEIIKGELSRLPYLSQFILEFPEGVEGDKVLNQYISYTSRKILKNFLLNLEGIIKLKIFSKKNSLSIAKLLGLYSLSVENLDRAEYFKGEKLLEAEIKGLNSELGYIQDSIKSLENSSTLNSDIKVSNPLFELKWEPIYQEGQLKVKSNFKIKIILLSFICGLIFSLLIIFGQNIKRNVYQK